MTTDPPEPKARRKWHFYKWLVLLIVATFAYAQWRAYAFRSAFKQAEALGWDVQHIEPFDIIRMDWKATFKKETWLNGGPFVRVPVDGQFVQHPTIIQRLNPIFLMVEGVDSSHAVSTLTGLTHLKQLILMSETQLKNLNGLQNLTALIQIEIYNADALTNVDGLKNLLALKTIIFTRAKKLTNVDALKNLSALERLQLYQCTGLTNVDGLKDHKELQAVNFTDCTGLTNVDGLKNLPALKEVWISGSTGLTEDSIDALKATLPNTKVHTDEPSPAPESTDSNTTSEARDTDRQPVNTDTPPPAPKPIKPPPTNGERIPEL